MITIKYATNSALTGATTTTGVAVNSTTDFTGAVDIAGLAPNTQYWYTPVIDGVDQYTAPYPTFKTFPASNQPGVFSFVFGSCTYQGGTDTIFDYVPSSVAFLMHLGDTAYQGSRTTLAQYRQLQQDHLAGVLPFSSRYGAMRGRTPVFSMWDDNDIAGSGESIPPDRFASALQAFKEYSAKANPDSPTSGALYYSFQVGDVGFFVPDERSYRSDAWSVADGPEKTLLGATQLGILKNWLLVNNSALKIKFICSETPASGYGTTGNDAWGNGYQNERANLWDFIDVNNITGVVFLAGDNHWAGAFKTTYGATTTRPRYEFMACPFNATPHTVSATTPDPVNGPIFWSYGNAMNMGVVTVDTTVTPATVSFQLYGTAGSLGSSYLTTLTQEDIDIGLATAPVPLSLAGTFPNAVVGSLWTGVLNFTGDYGASITMDVSAGTKPAWIGTPTVDYVGRTITYTGTPTAAESVAFTPRATPATGAQASLSQAFIVTAAAIGYWDPTHVSGSITLSDSNKTATGTFFAWKSVYGVTASASGLRYFEIAVSGGVRWMCGIGNASATTGSYMGSNSNGWGAISTGNKYNNGSQGSSGIGSFVAGDVISMVFDPVSGSLWFGKNGTVSGDPAAGTGAAFTGITGPVYPAFSPESSTGVGTLRVMNSEFSYTKPVGATSWSGA